MQVSGFLEAKVTEVNVTHHKLSAMLWRCKKAPYLSNLFENIDSSWGFRKVTYALVSSLSRLNWTSLTAEVNKDQPKRKYRTYNVAVSVRMHAKLHEMVLKSTRHYANIYRSINITSLCSPVVVVKSK